MVSVKHLRVNPAQMRTKVQANALAELAMQVRGGIDPRLPLLVKPTGDGSFTVISGHRRWLALMIAYIAHADTTVKPVSAEQELEMMEATIDKLCPVVTGFVHLSEDLYISLLDLVPETLTVPIEVWDGSPEHEILLLLRANMGAEEPDLKGQAHAFRVAVDRGVSIPTLAQTTGLPETMVEAIIGIPTMPEAIQEGLDAGTLDLEVMPTLMQLNKGQRQAIAHAMKEDMKDPVRPKLSYTGAVRLAALQVTNAPRILSRKHVTPESHNRSVILNAIWNKAMKEAKSSVLKNLAIASMSGELRPGDHRWANVLGEIPAVEKYFVTNRWGTTFGLSAEALEFLPDDVKCDTCAYNLLPQDKRLRNDLEVPCRQSKGFPDEGRCVYGTPADQPFSIKLPWYWDIDGGEEITSAEALVEAWEKQAAFDAKSGKGKGDEGESDIEKQREQIRFFMQYHDQPPFVVNHPWSTNCAVCQYYRDDSPVKSAPDAPHCQWAKGRQNLSFLALVPTDDGIIHEGLQKIIPEGQGLVPMAEWEDLETGQVKCAIPWCLQFKPAQPWSEIIPEAQEPSPFSREMMIDVIDALAKSVNHNVYSVYSRAVLQFLTGRPEKASGHHRKSFEVMFKKQQKKLSDQQLWTLVQWLTIQFTARGHISSTMLVPMVPKVVIKCGLMPFLTALEFIQEARIEKGEE